MSKVWNRERCSVPVWCSNMVSSFVLVRSPKGLSLSFQHFAWCNHLFMAQEPALQGMQVSCSLADRLTRVQSIVQARIHHICTGGLPLEHRWSRARVTPWWWLSLGNNADTRGHYWNLLGSRVLFTPFEVIYFRRGSKASRKSSRRRVTSLYRWGVFPPHTPLHEGFDA